MVRSLPWLQSTTRRPSKTTTPTSRQLKTSASHSATTKHATRTPSTSPPPQAPSNTPMKVSDNAWIMVEDEFYATAQSFTQHLHHAEYKRLKSLSDKRIKDSSHDILRPVTGVKLSKETQVKMNARKRREKMEGALQAVDHRSDDEKTGSQSSEEEFPIGDKNLACLMQGTGAGTVQKRSLVELSGQAQANTRAAAGFYKQTNPLHRDSNPRHQPLRLLNSLSDDETDDDLEINFNIDAQRTKLQPSIDRSKRPDTSSTSRKERRPGTIFETDWLPSSRPTASKDKRRKATEEKAIQT